METRTVHIPAISCGHCKKTIETEVGELAGVRRVAVDLASKDARIEWEAPARWDEIADLLEEIGYPAEAGSAASSSHA